MRIAVCLALAVVCSAQVPNPCESPKQWEGRRLRVDMNKEYTISRITYDKTNKRTRAIDEVEMGTNRHYYDVLRLHAIGKEYRLNLKTRQCNVTKLSHPFRTIGVPLGARYLFESDLGVDGVPGEQLTAIVYQGTFRDGAKYVVQVSSPDCFPLSLDVHSNTTEENYHDSYYDVQLGISDMAAFVAPQGCITAK